MACDLCQVLDKQNTVTGNPMGDAKKDDLRVSFDNRVRVKSVGSKVTTDAGLLANRELDKVLSPTRRLQCDQLEQALKERGQVLQWPRHSGA